MLNRPRPEQLGEPDLKVAGFQLWVHGREFPDGKDQSDANWLIVSAHGGASGASVWASGAIVEITDLTLWATQCESLAMGQGQEAKLEPVEPHLRVVLDVLAESR